jgi:hypothetical protein
LQKTEFWPSVTYDRAVPTFKKVLGYEPGERISSHAQIMRYMEALAVAQPSRMRVFEYAKSWEGRKLVYAAIGSEANIGRLDEIRRTMGRLADPRHTSDAEARPLMASLPAVIWLGYGVHGNEISSPDAAMLTAYHLLAARQDKIVDDILAGVLVLLDPTQNPDGRDRFVHHFEESEGLAPDASPLAAEHVERWPGGRTNHYQFDLNRDWFAITQPETRGRIRALREWWPLVFVDLHEMGSESTYYFAPEADPFNPHLAANLREVLSWFGKNNARWFDQFGFSYFTREVYDNFYPGYGASWPCYYGGVAMTYEQASARGLLVRRSNESVFSFRDTVREHFVASISTAETAAHNRAGLIANFYQFRKTAIEEGSKESIREYLLPRRGDTSLVDKLASKLVEQGVEVKRAPAEFLCGGAHYPAGSYVVPLAQPAKRLIRVLLDANVPLEEKFMQEQERRRKKKLGDEIYDVTAWSMPLIYNVEAIPLAQPSPGSFELVHEGTPRGTVSGKATLAYLVPWGTTASARFLTAALRADLRVLSTDKPFTQRGRNFPGGTLIIKLSENAATVTDTVAQLAAASGAEVVGTDTGWVDDGVNFGSRYVVAMRRPIIALAWDQPVASGSAGHTRFVIERQYNYPVTPVRTELLATADLSRFSVIILPEAGPGAGYSGVFGTNGPRRLKDWVAAGGTLIGIGSATSFLADPRTGLLAISQENVPRPATEPPKVGEITPPAAVAPAAPATPGGPASIAAPAPDGRVPGKLFAKEEDYLKAIQPDSELPDDVQGVIVRARLDPDHWITAGVGETVTAMAAGRLIFTPIKLDKGVNAAVFVGPDRLVASGYMWEENRKQMAYKPLVAVQREGRGVIIAFTADPNFRAYMDGLNVLFLNAVFRGPAHARPAP